MRVGDLFVVVQSGVAILLEGKRGTGQYVVVVDVLVELDVELVGAL